MADMSADEMEQVPRFRVFAFFVPRRYSHTANPGGTLILPLIFPFSMVFENGFCIFFHEFRKRHGFNNHRENLIALNSFKRVNTEQKMQVE